MRLPGPLSASIALHGAALAFLGMTPYVAVRPPGTLQVAINERLPALHDAARVSSTAPVAGPRHRTPQLSAAGAAASEPAVPAASGNPAPATTAAAESVRASDAAAADATPPGYEAAYLDNPEPVYPAVARRRGLEGRVLLEVTVDPQGRPARIRVAQGSGEDSLDQAAVDAVQGWRFVPAMRGHEAVEGRVRVPVRFRLGRR